MSLGLEAAEQSTVGVDERRARCFLLAIQILFLLVGLIGVNQPFLSTHNERQNQTYDVARHVFREGWTAIITPKASFSMPGFEKTPFTVTEQEAPFYGIIGWPFEAVFGHGRAVVRLTAIAFALLSISLIYRIARVWLAPMQSVFAAAIFATAPLVLQFGQVPMPDILCTAGMLAAFWLALRNKLLWSTLAFTFAVLSKCNVMVLGLPVLCALLVARNCKSIAEVVRVSLLWGCPPVAGLLAWATLTYLYSPPTPWTLWRIFAERGGFYVLLQAKLYLFTFACLFIVGIGVAGTLLFIAAARRRSSLMDSRIKWSIIAANILYLALVLQKIQEPQYFLPQLAWMSVACAFGVEPMLSWFHGGGRQKILLTIAVAVHVLVAAVAAIELKSPRVRNLPEIERVGAMIPPGARVITAYPFFGGSAAVWLDHNVCVVHSVGELQRDWQNFRKLGFAYLVVFHVDHRYKYERPGQAILTGLRRVTRARSSPGPETPEPSDEFTAIGLYADHAFTNLFNANGVALYSLPVDAAIGR